MRFKELTFGTAGIPLSTEPRNTLQGLKRVKELGLGGMELEFVHSINVNKETAEEIRKTNKELTITAHGSYYINLNAKEKEKIAASRERIIQAARRTNEAGGYSVTFHAAYYLGGDPERVHEKVREEIKKIIKQLKEENNNIWVRPETTGKPTQYGSLKELIRLSQEIEQVMPCVDFAHLHARTGGKNNTREEFQEIMNQIEQGLGKEGLRNMHIHMSGIAYSEKGEKHHLPLRESDLNYEELIRTWKEYKIKGIVVSESPNIEQDALLMKETYEKIR